MESGGGEEEAAFGWAIFTWCIGAELCCSSWLLWVLVGDCWEFCWRPGVAAGAGGGGGGPCCWWGELDDECMPAGCPLGCGAKLDGIGGAER